MEVSGQKPPKGKDVKLCNFCEDFDITTCADGYCVECEVYTCRNCFVKHKERKINRDHSLVKIGESQSAKAKADDTFEACRHHKGKFLELYCPKHDQVCCSECLVLKHNDCKLDLVQNKSASYQSSSEFSNLTAMITKYSQQAKACASSMERNGQQPSDIYEQFLRDLNAFEDEVIERVKRMKETLLIQGKDVMMKDEKKISKVQKESEELIAELTRQNDLLKSKMGQPNKLYAASVAVKPELKKIQQQLNILQAKSVVTRYTFKRDERLETTIKEMKGIGLLQHAETVERKEEIKNTNKMNTPFRLEKKQHATGDVRTEDDQCELKQVETSLLRTKQNVETKKQVIKTERQTISTNVSPLYKRQLFCKNLDITGDILSYSPNVKNEMGLYIDNRQLLVGSYFEIEVVSIGSRGSIALGFVFDDSSNFPGVEYGTVGYHSDGRILDNGNCTGSASIWNVGDRIRCRIMRVPVYGGLYFDVQFTYNGKPVGSTWVGNSSHFAVGMSSPGDKVKVIF